MKSWAQMKLLILSAHNEEFREIGEISGAANRSYARKYGMDFRLRVIPANYNRMPSWAKVRLIANALPHYDYVLWVDADAMITGKRDIRELIKPATLNIAKDLNGINCGVMAWRNKPESFKALERIENKHADYATHPWFEQAALMDFVDELDVAYQPKQIWNAYPEDATRESIIRHWPGMPNEERLPAMSKFAKTLL